MNKLLKMILSLSLALVLLSTAALAETVSFDGTVTAAQTFDVIAPLGGSVERLNVHAGDLVTADTAAAVLRTTKYYAAEDGTVTAVFGQVGDDAAAITGRYGAVISVEGTTRYTISASLRNAYSSVETTYLTAGQTVYLKARNSTARTGLGIVTLLDASSYTIEVTEGSFIVGESVDAYSAADRRDNQRVGRGNIARNLPTAVTAESGVIVSLAVKPGDTVKRGDLLMETLEGAPTYDSAASNQILCGVDGIVAVVNVAQGDAVTQDAIIATIYPSDAMQIEGLLSESDLGALKVGDEVEVTLYWNEEDDVIYNGKVIGIAAVAAADAVETSYKVTVSFTPDANTRYGMNATVNTIEKTTRK